MAGGVATVVLLWLLGNVLLLVFAAILLAVALRGASDRLGSLTGWGPQWCLGAVAFTIFAVIVATGWFSGARLADQSSQLWEQLIRAGSQAKAWLEQYPWGRAVLSGASPEGMVEDSQKLATGLGKALMGVVGVFASLVIAIVAALYFAASPSLYQTGLLRLLPKRRRARGTEVLEAIGHTLRQWLLGQGIAMLLIAAASYIGLAIIGVPLAPLLALIAGATNFVPYVGPFIGAAPAILVAFGEGPETALWVVALFVGIQFVEGNFLTPMVQKRMTRLPPALTILSQTVLGTLFGVLGVILATPLLAALIVGVRMMYVEDVLGDRRGEASG